MNIYATELYHALQKAHPEIWQVKDYLGEENFEKVISPYLDENGKFDPDPIWEMIFPNITPAENMEKTIGQIWYSLSSLVLEKWYTAMNKEQAETLCELIGYFGTITFCSITILIKDVPNRWRDYHPGEGFLSINEK